jgi:hypothetical protein
MTSDASHHHFDLRLSCLRFVMYFGSIVSEVPFAKGVAIPAATKN